MATSIRIALTVLGVLVLVLGALWIFQRRIIYLPSSSPGTAPAGWTETSTVTDDGLEIAGWVHPGDPDAPVVLVFHGNAGDRGDRVALGSRLVSEGFGVAMFDYRGYGGNPGAPSEEGLRSDARAMADWVASNLPDRAVLYFGESLGAGVAVHLAAERPPAGTILRSPFTSLGDVAAVHYPIPGVRSLVRDSFPVEATVPLIAGPVTVVAGSADRTVPPDQSLAVYEAAAEQAEWVLIEGADHNDPELSHGPAVIAAVVHLSDHL